MGINPAQVTDAMRRRIEQSRTEEPLPVPHKHYQNSYRILNLGAGVQSTTVALMGLKNWEYWHYAESLPYPAVGLIDYAIFADTQEEPKAVYAHLEWLKREIGQFIEVMVRSAGSLGDNLVKGISLSNHRFVSIPAFTAKAEGEKLGIMQRQ